MKNLIIIILMMSSNAFAINCQWADKTTYGNPTSGVFQEINNFSYSSSLENAPVAFDLSKFWGFECASYQIYESFGTVKVVRLPKDQSMCSMGYARSHELVEFTPVSGMAIEVKDNVLSNKVGKLVVIGITCK